MYVLPPRLTPWCQEEEEHRMTWLSREDAPDLEQPSDFLLNRINKYVFLYWKTLINMKYLRDLPWAWEINEDCSRRPNSLSLGGPERLTREPGTSWAAGIEEGGDSQRNPGNPGTSWKRFELSSGHTLQREARRSSLNFIDETIAQHLRRYWPWT